MPGAKDTLAIYFMYDVKHYEPAEWSSPPLEGRIVDRPGEGKAMMGRGAVNQKGPETAFLTALRAFKTAGASCRSIWCWSPRARRRSPRPISTRSIDQPEVRAALEKAVGIVIPSAAQIGRRPDDLDAGRQGGDRAAADRRAARNGAAGRPRTSIRASRPVSTARPGAWSRRSTAGRRGRPHAGDRRLVRECEAADARARRS